MNEIQEREKQLRLLEAIVELTPTLICTIDLSGNFTMVNSEWQTVLGYAKEDLEHTSILTYVHFDDRESTLQQIVHLSKGNRVLNFINRYRSVNGEYHSLEWRSYVSDNLIYGTARDITQKLAEERERQQELDLLSLLFEQTLTGIFLMLLDNPVDWEHAPDKDAALDIILKEQRVVRANQAFIDQFRATEDDILGKSALELFQDNTGRAREIFRSLLNEKKLSQNTMMIRKDGTAAWMQGDYHCLFNKKGEFVGHFGLQIDISNQREYELALRKSERMYRLITEHAFDVIWVYNFAGDAFTYMSPSVERLLGYSADEIVGKPFEITLHPSNATHIKHTLLHNFKEFKKNPVEKMHISFQSRQIKKDRKSFWSESTVTFRLREHGDYEAIGVTRDISTRKRYEDKILHLSYRDQLTGLYNRRYFEEFQSKLLHEPQNLPVSIIVCDVNGLKLTNDVFGHLVGDRLLVACASALLSVKRSGDSVARIGGDEFVIIMLHASEDDVRERILEIQKILKEKQIADTKLSISFGTATAHEPVEVFEPFFRQAEDAMYRNKLLESTSYKYDVIKVLIKSLYAKSTYEKKHSERVSYLAVQLGKVFHFSEAELDQLRLAGILHDIGKIGISSDLLNQHRPLTNSEWTQLRRHAEMGYQIVRSIPGFDQIANWIFMHHERIDGEGYPRGLKSDYIPFEAKIIAVANAFDAMTSEFGYRTPRAIDEALQELRNHAGTQFDTDVVDAIEKLSQPVLMGNSDFEEGFFDDPLRIL